MLKTQFLVLAALAALAASAAPAGAQSSPPRISLITLPPAGDLQGAFGHSMLRIDADGDLATTADQIVYDYGVWSMADLDSLLSEWSGLAVLATGLLDGEMTAAMRARRDPGVQSDRPQLLDEGIEDVLVLPGAARRRLRERMEEKFGVGQGGRTYLYRHYTRNCATELRDDVFGVLPDSLRDRHVGDRLEGTSRRDLLRQDLSRAIERHGALDTIRGGAWDDHRALFTIAGVRPSIESPDDVFAMARRVTERLGLLSPSESRQRIEAAFTGFNETLDATPISRWESAYTPDRLRRLLVDSGVIER